MSFHVVKSRLAWLPESKLPKTGRALVIPANDHLWMISGPGMELKKQLGKEFELDAVRLGPVEPGEVVASSGAGTGYDHLLHAVVTGQDLQWQTGVGEKAAVALLERAVKMKLDELVVHPFYRGTHAARPDAAREMLTGFLRVMERGIPVKLVQVVVQDNDEQRLLQDLFLQLLANA
ncbi:MAG: hypothetical protein KC729_21345 [Candidatus Eisenbacteria bacterium]|uniref:Macro domain-containing protein n=1 Tax=Eiseniibacteriota bacterium TaxID=2212470 RepID=A0A956RT77_UNCEI|nr:hypothetical protein [Candidatus Eisenbacteria bacterium]